MSIDLAAIEHDRVVQAADRFLREEPATITACRADRSTAGVHDYFSEGDYWWPDPANPDGPYVRRDGMTNPENFVLHRNALIRLSVQMPALTAAWLLTGNDRYARHAVEHLRAWFLDSSTRMNPNLRYAQAVHGRSTGRRYGIIDTVHLVEVTRAISLLRKTAVLSAVEHEALERWFADYLRWMIRSRCGVQERTAKDNHGACWVMQAAQFALYIGNHKLAEYCTERYKRFLVPNQIAPDGSLPLELQRTKPYCYSLFNLDALATICRILSTPRNDLWGFELSDGRGLRKAMAFMYPYIADKGTWAHPRDVQYFEQFPIRQPGLLFAGLAYAQPAYLSLWKELNPDSTVDEVVRNNPIRQPVLWVHRRAG
jgi:hypothetical protein